jgi:small conductance mechanosensitive channel
MVIEMHRSATWPTALALLLAIIFGLSFARADDASILDTTPAAPTSDQSVAETDGDLVPVNYESPVEPASATEPAEPAETNVAEPVTDAIRIARAERSLDSDRRRLEELTLQLESPKSEYRKAEAAFKELDNRYNAARDQLKQWESVGDPRVGRAQEDFKFLHERWQLARERFDMAIEERKIIQKKIGTLQEKINHDKASLEKVSGVTSASPSQGETNSQPTTSDQPSEQAPLPAATTSPTTQTAAVPSTAENGTAGNPPPAAAKSIPQSVEPPVESSAPLATALTPGVPAAPLVPAADAKATAAGEQPTNGSGGEAVKEKPKSQEILDAEEEAEQKAVEANEAREKAKSITERLELLRESISEEEQLVDRARMKAEQAETETQSLTREMKQQLLDNPAGAAGALAKITEAQLRMATARKELRASQDRLDDLHAELHDAQSDHIAALQEAEQKRVESEVAAKRVTELKNPLSLQNMLQWTIDRAPKLALIIFATLVLNYLAKGASVRMVRLAVFAGERGSHADRQNRADTLGGVFRNAASLAILGGGLLMLLDTVGVPVVPLLGGAAIFGLAVAFGAQNLIRDYFSGFMVLMEDQYGVSDVVRIGDVSGQVEEITLRITRLRDLEGIVHFIPHGTITTVSNFSHGWSRALFDVGVAYKEDVDQVIAVLKRLAEDLRQDPEFGPMIIDGPEMLGLNSFDDSAVVIRFHLKTRPLMQWPVRRELNRRIKRRFDELGIEIPFPHRTLYFGDGQAPNDSFGASETAGRRAG